MISLAVDFLLPGTVLGSPLYDKKGNLVVEAKTPFTVELIEDLKKKHIERVYYTQAQSPEPETIQHDPRKIKTILQPRILELSERVSAEISRSIRAGEFIQTLDVHQLVDLLFKLLHAFGKFPPEILLEKKSTDPDYSHHLNVCITSMVLALKHGFENTLVKQIGIGAFLHDIGKNKLPEELRRKTAGYSQEEVELLKKHTTLGFELIKLNGQLSSIVRKIVLFHHEATNGTGYPLGLNEKDVGYYPYIVSLANIFDNLTTTKPYRQAYTLKDTLAMLIQTAGKKLPAYLVQLFVKHVTLSLAHGSAPKNSGKHPNGTFVILNTQEIAQVLRQNPEEPEKPRVRIIKDSKGHSVDPPLEAELAQDITRMISEVLNEEVQKQLIRRYPLA